MKYIPRLLIAGLIIFELLNEFGLLHYTLDFTWLGLAITSILAWTIIELSSYLLKKSCGLAMHGWAMMVAVAALYIDALGDILRLYGKLCWYDQIAHLAGGITVAVLIFNALWQLNKCQKIKFNNWGIGFFTICAAALFGALYEIEEYLEDFFTGSHRLGDGPDTANDLMLNILGAIAIIVIINTLITVFCKSSIAQNSKLQAPSSK